MGGPGKASCEPPGGVFLNFLSKRYCGILWVGYFVSPVTEEVVLLAEVSRPEASS
jgi:hypothetical protein